MNQSQRVLVAGTGKSGIAAAKLILDRGGEVLLYDGNAGLDEETVKKNFPEGAKKRPFGGGTVYCQSGYSYGQPFCWGSGRC